MRKVLGRGLDALIGQREGLENVPLELIDPNPYQPRQHFDEGGLEELVESIKQNGLLQPVLVRRCGGRYQLIAGERRLRAAKIAGLATIPAVVRDVEEEKLLEISLVENIQREDLNPLEEAAAYKRLQDEFGLTQEEIAAVLGKDRSSVANTLRLLRLPEEVKQAVREGRISRGHALAIASLEDENEQIKLCQAIVEGGLSVREAERVVRRSRKGKRQKRDPNIVALEDRLRERLGTDVELKISRSGKGRLVIHFFSEEDLARLLEILEVKL